MLRPNFIIFRRHLNIFPHKEAYAEQKEKKEGDAEKEKEELWSAGMHESWGSGNM